MTHPTHQTTLSEAQLEAAVDVLENTYFASAMWCTITGGTMNPRDGYAHGQEVGKHLQQFDTTTTTAIMQRYIARLKQRAGIGEDDPMGAMLLDQIAMLHFRIPQLHMTAATSTNREEVMDTNATAMKFTQELYRLVERLDKHRKQVRAATPRETRFPTFRLTSDEEAA